MGMLTVRVYYLLLLEDMIADNIALKESRTTSRAYRFATALLTRCRGPPATANPSTDPSGVTSGAPAQDESEPVQQTLDMDGDEPMRPVEEPPGQSPRNLSRTRALPAVPVDRLFRRYPSLAVAVDLEIVVLVVNHGLAVSKGVAVNRPIRATTLSSRVASLQPRSTCTVYSSISSFTTLRGRGTRMTKSKRAHDEFMNKEGREPQTLPLARQGNTSQRARVRDRPGHFCCFQNDRPLIKNAYTGGERRILPSR
ncbi:uncharacterized protein B0H18DRAFT_955063 [Fomitopsis serialis]|uniref:uncharacterized protein n=1 Tax=Fomitopsis serialis TaxID=139415 RepID=UPI00200753D4|nr:uncharacterized protein B0H18DRAFT_955063 [Neoantrodia serialis]KAH9925548.1 hypothetical protein B0H18DRAFT_955063 [Neoantrodia serialis]